MLFHMRTTLIIPDHLIREIKRRAASTGQTLSAVVAEVVRRGLEEPDRTERLAPLPVHRLGRPRVNVADRDALDRVMEGT